MRGCVVFRCHSTGRRDCCADCQARETCSECCLNAPERCGLCAGEVRAPAVPPTPVRDRRSLPPRMEEERRRILEDGYARGLTDRQIAEAAGITGPAVFKWRRRHGLPANWTNGRKPVPKLGTEGGDGA